MEHESPVKKEETVIVKAEEKSEMPEIDGFER